MPPDEIEYDIVAGVSIGAYNASLISIFPPGKEKDAVKFLAENWEIDTSDLFSFYTPKWLTPFRRKSITNNEGLSDMLAELLEDKPF